MPKHPDAVLVDSARHVLADAIEELSDCDRAMICPIADWLVTLRQMIVEMRQYDGSPDA